MFIKFFRFLKGSVKIRISGYSPERFMNLCGNHNILLWNIENHCDYYIMCISIAGFFELKPFLKKTKTKVDVLKRYGLPFLIPKLIQRKIFVLGLSACIIGMFFLSHFIWAISISGNTSITTDVFMDYLKMQKINYGMAKNKVDIEGLEANIRKDYQNVTWASARINGTKLEIMIKENEHLEADLQIAQNNLHKGEQKSSDLVAQKDGIVVDLVTRNGVPQIKKGSEVTKGDILIKGQIPILAEDGTIRSYQYCDADADIYLQCKYPYQKSIPFQYQKKEYTGREKKIAFIELLGNTFTFYWNKNPYVCADIITDKKQFKLFGNFYLPFFTGKIIIKEYQVKEVLREKKEAEMLLKEEFNKNMETLGEKGVQIIEKNVKIVSGSKKLTLLGDVTVIEKTGKTICQENITE